MWKIIEKMEDQLQEELDGACAYIKCALSMKENDAVVADLYYNMAQQELAHYNNIHTVLSHKVDMMINDPEYQSMKIIYDYLNDKHIEHVTSIKAMMTMYKE